MTKDQKKILQAFDKYKAEMAEKMLKAWKCIQDILQDIFSSGGKKQFNFMRFL